MKSASIVLVLVLAAACGGGSAAHLDARMQGDDDATIDSNVCNQARIVPEDERAPMLDRFHVRDVMSPSASASAAAALAGSGSAATCDVLAQTGCTTGQKCTWIEDQTMPVLIGHVGCAPNGTVATGGSCTYGAPGATGYDNCVKGDVCNSGKCKTICDLNGGAPMCGSAASCTAYGGLFDDTGANIAGVCDASCDPLADNDILGSGHKPGSACGSDQGCYGYPNYSPPTHWACAHEVNPTLTHRSACTSANGCENANGSPYLNGCAQGYEPLVADSTGSNTIVCVALCKPGNTYMGNTCQHPAGESPHACDSTDARGTFNTATATNNGDHCVYSWMFELDGSGNLVRSPTSDTVGFCLDHSKYQYDSNGDGTPDAVWPLCSTLPLTAAGSNDPTAGEFGCVDSMTAGVTAANHAPHDLRLPYSYRAR